MNIFTVQHYAERNDVIIKMAPNIEFCNNLYSTALRKLQLPIVVSFFFKILRHVGVRKYLFMQQRVLLDKLSKKANSIVRKI